MIIINFFKYFAVLTIFHCYFDIIVVVDVNETTIESGNITNWSKYQKENFFPINQLFSRGNGPEYIRLRDILKLNLEIITTWDTWSDCEVCGRPLGDGIRKKKGHCRIKIRQVVNICIFFLYTYLLYNNISNLKLA